MSLGTFERAGYNVSLKDGKAKIVKGSLVVLSGTRKDNNIYLLDGSVIKRSENIAATLEQDSMALLWHKRLGHISNQGLVELMKQQAISDIRNCDFGFCETCIFGKHKRVKFTRGKHTTIGVLDYVHSDLWGPAKVESLGGARYFMSIIDDFSRRVWVFILKNKSEAFSRFKEWKKLVETQTGKVVKKLRTDNGLEFCSGEFNQFCKSNGIVRHLTVPGTPQQNGLAERMNRTLLEKVRCMLTSSGLAKQFWAEAVTTAVYLVNRSPSSAIKMKTPMDVWSGVKADYKNLKVFGSLAYAHVNKGKLEPRACKCIFLGYPEGVKGYRLWRVEEVKPKVFVSRDVVFQENILYKDLLKYKEIDTGPVDVQI